MKCVCDTKPRILEAAVELFSKNGYSGVSMRDVAREVGITPPALYNHFDGKETLYRAAVIAAFAGKSTRLISAMSACDDALQCLQQFVAVLTAEMQEDHHFHRLMQRELLDADEGRLTFLESSIFGKVRQPFLELLEKLKPGCDANLLSDLIFGMAKQHFSMRPIRSFQGMAKERTASAVADLIMQLLTPYFEAGN